MGGVNCPPMGDMSGSPELTAAYTTSLATYCGQLFAGAEKFYGANAAIERAIQRDGDLGTALEMLEVGERELTGAQGSLGTTAALWGQASSQIEVNFGEQLDLLSTAAARVATARLELQALTGGSKLQSEIWSQSEVTGSFVAALEAVNAALQWQARFAQASTKVELAAAV